MVRRGLLLLAAAALAVSSSPGFARAATVRPGAGLPLGAGYMGVTFPKGQASPALLARVRAGASSYIHGIDVSNWQGTVNYGQVAGAGYKFVFAKATEGVTYNDPYYGQNRTNAKAAGLYFGAYHFARPDNQTTTQGAVAEADHFVSYASPKSGEFLPVLDLEVAGPQTTSQRIAWVAAWLNEVYTKTGVKPMIYTSNYYWTTYMGNTTQFASQGYRLWIASWFASSPTVPAGNWNSSGWTFWQYADNGSVPGVSGNCDLDAYVSTSFSGVIIGGGGSGGGPFTDGGFEGATSSGNSAPGWKAKTNIAGRKIIVVGGPYFHSGSNYAEMGGANGELDTLSQSFAVPSGSAALRFWTNIVTTATSGTDDRLRVQLATGSGTVTLLTLSNANATSDSNTNGVYFQPSAISLSSYAGQTVRLIFRVSTNGSMPTTFRIDDVAVS